MFFRDELKETMETLYLTKQLEDVLKQNGARGTSLSDKIKSYQKKEEYDFDESWEFRAYKRGLLDGRYNPLRWVAHERNQVMHQKNYLISEYAKFKYTIKDSIKYFQSRMRNTVTLESFILGFFKFFPYLFVFGWVAFVFKDRILTHDINWVVFAIVAVFGFGILMQVGEIVSNILKIAYQLFNTLQTLFTQQKLLVVLLVLSYIFWGKDISYVEVLLERLKELF